MILAPVIALDPTAAQEKHFRKACGVARLGYNWALAQWKRQYEAGDADCGHVVDARPLHVRQCMCPVCGCVHDRDTNAATNLELVGRATPEPAQMPTCGDMEALAVEQSATKLPWMNRKRDRRTHVRTN